MKPATMIKALTAVVLLGISSPHIFAAGTETWGGNTDANWNTAGNWTTSGGSTPPASGDSLVFGAAGSSGLSLNNNISGLTVNNLTLNSGASAFTIGGNALTLAGILTDNAANNETFGGIAISAGVGAAIKNLGSGTLALGAVSHGSGGAVDFTLTGPITTTTANNNGILGGWATTGNTADWAANNGGGNIITYTGYTGVTGNLNGSGAAALNWKTTGNVTLTATATINSLNQQHDFTVNSGVTMTLGSGGLILGSTERWLLGSGVIKSGTSELFIHANTLNYANGWRIMPAIQDGAFVTTVIKDGSGQVQLHQVNTYTGGTIVNSGIMSLGIGGGAGTVRGALTINPGATVNLRAVDALGYNAGQSATPININGGTLDNLMNGNNAYISTFNLTGGTLAATGGGAYNFNGASSGLNSLAAGSVSTVSGPVALRASGLAINVAQGTVPGGIDLRISGVISGVGFDITKTGAGTLQLSGANTYTGGTAVNAGTLSVSNANALGSGALTMGGGNLDCSSANLILNNNIAQNWNADFTFIGSQNLNLGTGAVTLNATRQVAVTNTLTVGGGITDSGAGYGLTKTGNGTLKLNGANSYTGTTAVNGGVLLVANTTQGNGPVTVADGAAAGVTATADTTYWMPGSLTVGSSTGGALQFGVVGTTQPAMAPSSLTLNGTTTINISSAPFVNNVSYPLFSGYTSGTLVLGSQPNGLLGHLVNSGGTVSYAVTNVAVTTWTAAVSTNWDTTTANWTNSVGGNHFAANNPVQLNDSANGTGPLLVNITPSTVAPAAIVVSNTAKSYVIGGLAISGSTGLTKTGNNTLTLTGTNTFAGDIAISGGTVEIGGAGQLGGGNYLANIQDDATLKVNTTAAQTLSGTISGNGALVKTNTGMLTLSGANTFVGGVTNNAGTLQVGNNAGLGTGDLTLNGGTLQNAANIAINNNIVSGGGGTISIPAGGQNVYYGGNLSGTGPLTIGGGGPIMSLNLGFAANTLTGTITIPASPNQTVVRFKTPTAGSATAAWDITGDNSVRFVTLDFDGTIDFGSLTGPGIIAGNGGNQKIVSVGALGTSTTFSGSLRNGSATEVALTKVGAGVLTLSGGNTYTGLTTVQNGSLVAAAAGAFGANASPIALGDATTIGGNLSPSLIIAGAYSMTHDVTVGYDGTATTGIYTLGGNTASSVTLTGSISLNQNLVVTQATGGTFTISGTLGGSGGLTKTGNGAVNLAGGYSYAGPTVVNAGTLSLNAAQSSSSSSALTINSATLALTLNDGNSSIYSADVVFTGNSVLNLNFGAATSPAAAAINASGFTVSNTGTNTINITGPGLVVGQYPIIYTGGPVPTNNFVLGALPLGVAGVLTNSGTSLDLLITGTGQNLVWYGADSLGNPLTTWNINTSSNWSLGNARYLQYSGNSYGDYVMFDDTLYTPSGADITLNTAVVPASVSFNNNSTPYSITGSGGIGGATSLVKSGSGALYLGTSNSYTGGTIVNGGTLSVAKDSALGASNGPVTLNNGVMLQYSNTTASVRSITMTANSTLDVAPGATAQLAGVVSGDASLTKTGNGALTLAGNNSYSKPTFVNAGTVNVSGAVTNTGYAVVGNVAGNAVLNVSGTLTVSNLFVGNASGAAGAVYQTAGSLTVSSGQGDCFDIGNSAGGFGYFSAIGGSVTANGIAIAGEANTPTGFNDVNLSGDGIMEVNGGTVNDAGWLVIARTRTTANSEIGVLNVYSGLLTYAGGGIVGPWGSGGTAIINILGGAVTNAAAVGVYLGNSGNTGILNLNGGLLAAREVAGYNGLSYSPMTYGQVNFNGGKLQASAANGDFIRVTSANIYSGGATIDNNGNAITIAQPLLAPTGNGVHGIASFTGGAGYIAPPIVIIANGVGDTTGTGATAIAQINPVTGVVTNIIITCPGVNYTAVPTFTVSGGGAITAATITGPTPAANTSGGLTAIGSGTTVLSGANTYTGNTTVSAGTLELAQATLATNSTVSIASSAVLKLDFNTTNKISALVLNGVTQPSGVYGSSTPGGYITGIGYLQVPSSGPTGPATITNSITGGGSTLSLAWPAGQGWRLQMQTNSLTTGLGTNWTYITDGSASSTNITVNPAKPAVFYRLANP